MRSKRRYITENYPIVNSILDKMSEYGYQNLENEEKIILNKYSEWLNSVKKWDFEEIINPKTIDYGQKEGNKFTTTLADDSEFVFKYDYTDELEDEDIHYGVVYWNDQEWVGLFATDKGEKITEIDFVCDEDFSGNEERLQDTLGKQIYQVRMFFEDEVIPGLMN
jgi:hypothetical protein